MTVQIEVSPEAAQIIEVLRGNAAALNLSLEAYLRRIIEAAPLLQTNGALTALEERPLSELLEGLIGVIDSREPYDRPEKERDAFGKGVIAKLEKQGIKLS
jgi:hypothetical protein